MRQRVRITEMTGQTLIAMCAGCVVDTLQALAGRSVAVSDSVRVDVSVAVAKLAKLNLSRNPRWVTVIAVRADLATWT